MNAAITPEDLIPPDRVIEEAMPPWSNDNTREIFRFQSFQELMEYCNWSDPTLHFGFYKCILEYNDFDLILDIEFTSGDLNYLVINLTRKREMKKNDPIERKYYTALLFDRNNMRELLPTLNKLSPELTNSYEIALRLDLFNSYARNPNNDQCKFWEDIEKTKKKWWQIWRR